MARGARELSDYTTESDVEHKLLRPLFEDVLGYPSKALHWKESIAIQMGRQKSTKAADLVAYHHDTAVVAVEAKRPTEPVRSGLSQVDSYAFALQTPYSIVTNGHQLVLRGYYSFNSRINVIDEPVDMQRKSGWKKLKSLVAFDNIPSAFELKANELPEPNPEKIQDYRRFLRKIHNEIRDREKLDPAAAFDELSKLLFLKAAEDEWRLNSPSKPVLTAQKIEEWEKLGRGKSQTFVNEWFQTATSELFPGVFDDHPSINLKPHTLRAVIDMLRPFHIRNGDVDVKGRAFEEFLPSQLRGKGLGQFFTPRPIVNFMADMAAISIHDIVVDFSCGSGGFLIKAFDQMQRYVAQLPAGTLKGMGTTRDKLLEDIKAKQIFGVDAEPRAARTAKMNMLMWGDGKQVVRGNALDTKDFNGNTYDPKEYSDKDLRSGCTLILANPPFGNKEKDKEILKRYALGGLARDSKAGKTEVLFIEKGLKLLRPEGKMLIVLPQGLMSGSSNARVRDYIHSEAEIRAIVSLPTHTFVQSGVPTVNTCILYLQKFSEEKRKLYDKLTWGMEPQGIRELLRTDPNFNYLVFMATAEFIGYEPSGRMIATQGEKTDLDLIRDDFNDLTAIERPTVDLFEFASRHYRERSFRRSEQTVRGTERGTKTSFVVPLKDTDERLDPPYYLLRLQAGKFIDSLQPLGSRIVEKKKKFRPRKDEELDAECDILSVSNEDGVTLAERAKGESFTQMKRVRGGDVVYNPMRINVGSIGVVPHALDGGLVSPDYVVFRSIGIDPHFLVTLLRSPFYRMYIDVVSTGSIRDRLYFQDLQKLRVPDVDIVEQAAVYETTKRVDDEARAMIAQIVGERTKTFDRLDTLVRTSSTNAMGVADTFIALARRWEQETGRLSSPTKKFGHLSYQKIIALGSPVVPIILRKMEKHPEQWFPALEAITHEKMERGTNAAVVAAAWLQWGRSRGLLA